MVVHNGGRIYKEFDKYDKFKIGYREEDHQLYLGEVPYDLAKSPNLAQIRRMLKKVFNKFSNLNGLLFHSDQGWQYQHVSYRPELQKHGIIQSMSRKGIAMTTVSWKHSLAG